MNAELVVVEINNVTDNWRVLSSHKEKSDAERAAHEQAITCRWPSRFSILIANREDLPQLDAAIKRNRQAVS